MADPVNSFSTGSSSDDATARVEALCQQGPDVVARVPGSSRVVAADIEGDPEGVPVVMIHGTPDSRLARHPDETIAAELGVRLLAVDRPGFGHTSYDPHATPTGFAADVEALLDHLAIDSAHLLAWSAGTLWALGVAGTLPDRIRSVTAVGGLVPVEAFDEAAVRLAAGPARQGMVETAAELGADLAAELIGPMLVPDPPSPAAALEHRAESGETDLETVPGATEQMAAACCDAVREGTDGLVRDVTVQLSPTEVDLAAIDVPVHLITGDGDTVCPPMFAQWYGTRIPHARVDVVPGAGHGLLLTHWAEILGGIAMASTSSLS